MYVSPNRRPREVLTAINRRRSHDAAAAKLASTGLHEGLVVHAGAVFDAAASRAAHVWPHRSRRSGDPRSPRPDRDEFALV